MKPTYVCEECGGEFAYGRPDEEAHKEAEEQFGVDGHAPGMAVVCHDCTLKLPSDSDGRWLNE